MKRLATLSVLLLVAATALVVSGRWIYDNSLSYAIRVLKATPTFTSLVVGPSYPTIQGWAFGRVLRSPIAEATFLEVYQEALPAGKVFALGGLHEISSPSFQALAMDFRAENPRTTSFTGCFYSDNVSAADLLDAWITDSQFALYRATSWPHREMCIFVDLPAPLLDRLRAPAFQRLFHSRWTDSVDRQSAETLGSS